MKKVFIASALRGNIEENQERARGYAREAILKGYLPIVPHIYFTQFLDDDIEEERNLGINSGIELMKDCDEMWCYGELTEGMKKEVNSFTKEVKYKEK